MLALHPPLSLLLVRFPRPGRVLWLICLYFLAAVSVFLCSSAEGHTCCLPTFELETRIWLRSWGKLCSLWVPGRMTEFEITLMIHMEVLAWSWAFMAQGVKTTHLRFTACAGIGIAVMRLEYGDGENTARSCWSVFFYSWLFRSGKNTLKCLGSQTCNY